MPEGHEKRLDLVISSLLQQLSVKDLELSEINQQLTVLVSSQMEDLKEGYKEAMEAAIYAHVFDRSLKLNDTSVYDATVKMLKSALEETCKAAPLDTLLPQSAALTAALGTLLIAKQRLD